jgi:ATP-dependent DNA ligase
VIRQIAPGKARAKFNETMWDSPNFIGQEKLDGERFLLHAFPDENRFTSRHISVKNGQFVDKTENIPHLKNIFIDKRVEFDLQGCIFDGEITYGKNSMSVSKVMGSLPKKSIDLQIENGWVTYNAFDILQDRGVDITQRPYSYRRKALLDKLSPIDDKYFKIVEDVQYDKKGLFESIIESGGEGIILKDTRAKYGDGWSKVKRSAQWDVVISGYKDPKKITKKTSGEESTSKYYEKDWIGAISFGQYLPDGQFAEFGFCSGIDEALREKISNNKEFYIGKVIEITAQERLASGHFRHPRFLRFRPDKNAESCVYRIGEV